MLIGGREAVKTGPRVALVAGGSGLTGHALLRLMLQQQVFERVIALSRRPLPLEQVLKIVATGDTADIAPAS